MNRRPVATSGRTVCFRLHSVGLGATQLALLCLVLPGQALAQNLLGNGAVETPHADDPQQPALWTPGVWGTDIAATTTWAPVSPPQGRSLRIEVKAIEGEGDALWRSEPIAIAADGAMRVSARCVGDVPGRLLVEARNGGAKAAWLLAATLPQTSVWQLSTGTVQLPPGTNTVRVAFAIATKGVVSCDDFELSALPPPPLAVDGSAEILTNGGFEAGPPSGYAPGWSFHATPGAVGQGQVMAGGGVTGDAAESKQFVRIQVESLQGTADVKWWSDPIRVLPGKPSWLMHLKWRSLVRAHLFLFETRIDGTSSFRLLRRLRPELHPGFLTAPPWETVQVGFSFAPDVVSVRVAVLLWQPGVVDLDDFRCARADASGDPQGPLRVSFAVDSLNGSVDDVLAVFELAKVRGSIYLPSSRIEAEGATALAKLRAAELSGIELGIFGEVPSAWLTADLAARRQTVIRAFSRLRDAGLNPRGFAPPDGLYDEAVADAIDSREGYVRSLGNGVNYPPVDYLSVQVRNVDATTTDLDILRWQQEARRHSGWLILRYSGMGPAGSIDLWRLLHDIEAVQAEGALVAPVGEVLGAWRTPVLAANEAEGGCSARRTAPATSSGGVLALVALCVAAALAMRRGGLPLRRGDP